MVEFPTSKMTDKKLLLWLLLALLAASSETKLITEFTLDELTNQDSNYQPISFNQHGSAGRQQLGESHQLHTPTRIQMIGE